MYQTSEYTALYLVYSPWVSIFRIVVLNKWLVFFLFAITCLVSFHHEEDPGGSASSLSWSILTSPRSISINMYITTITFFSMVHLGDFDVRGLFETCDVCDVCRSVSWNLADPDFSSFDQHLAVHSLDGLIYMFLLNLSQFVWFLSYSFPIGFFIWFLRVGMWLQTVFWSSCCICLL